MNSSRVILAEKLELYQQATAKTQTNRAQWNNAVKEFIFITLNNIKQMVDLDWSVIKIEGITNLESVRLQLSVIDSGITVLTNTEQKQLVKFRGALVFAQAHNGDILVLAEGPFIDQLTNKPEPVLLYNCDPSDLDENTIYDQAIEFIDIITDWENNTEGRGIIGFKTEKSE